MKRLLLPLLAALALPSAVSAESVWLIIYASEHFGGSGLEKVEMENMSQCELAGSNLMASKRFSGNHLFALGVECIKAK